jgi:chemotaxis protein CheY-P-specific phosphatase CheC
MVNMNHFEEDALMEITNMCIYNASLALSEMIKKPIDVKISSKSIISMDDESQLSDKPPIMFLSIYSGIEKGDLEGNIVLTFPKNSALYLYDELTNKEYGSTKIVDDSVKDILTEIGNILSGKILGILNQFLSIKAKHSIPTLVPSFGDQIYDYVYYNITSDYQKAILIKVDTKFKLTKENIIEGQIILLLSNKSFDNLLKFINKVGGKNNV